MGKLSKEAVRVKIMQKGIEEMSEEFCPMIFGHEGIEGLCGFNQESETDCVRCWKEVFEIDIENPPVKADMNKVNV